MCRPEKEVSPESKFWSKTLSERNGGGSFHRGSTLSSLLVVFCFYYFIIFSFIGVRQRECNHL